MGLIDFTNAARDIASKYDGSDQKRSICYSGERYMLKLPDRITSAGGDSYMNSWLSEHVCCRIIATIGLPVQETLLGTVMMRPIKTSELRTRPVVACKNFLQPDEVLIEFKVIEDSLLNMGTGKIPEIESIYQIMLSGNEYFNKELGEAALERYWDTFIVDALLANSERKADDWGYVINKDTEEVSLAPIYDCGSCLYPKITNGEMKAILSNPNEIQRLIDTSLDAALLLEDGSRASYKQFIGSLENEDCNKALRRMYPRIDMEAIAELIDDMDELSDIRKQFYKTMIWKRYEQIIEHAYNLLLERR